MLGEVKEYRPLQFGYCLIAFSYNLLYALLYAIKTHLYGLLYVLVSFLFGIICSDTLLMYGVFGIQIGTELCYQLCIIGTPDDNAKLIRIVLIDEIYHDILLKS